MEISASTRQISSPPRAPAAARISCPAARTRKILHSARLRAKLKIGAADDKASRAVGAWAFSHGKDTAVASCERQLCAGEYRQPMAHERALDQGGFEP